MVCAITLLRGKVCMLTTYGTRVQCLNVRVVSQAYCGDIKISIMVQFIN